MKKKASQASKTEKKIKILTGGYQLKAQALLQQYQHLSFEMEKLVLQKDTFNHLRQIEEAAIPHRLQVNFKIA